MQYDKLCYWFKETHKFNLKGDKFVAWLGARGQFGILCDAGRFVNINMKGGKKLTQSSQIEHNTWEYAQSVSKTEKNLGKNIIKTLIDI